VSTSTLRVVALGGGHGLHVSLSALRRVVGDLTAVVTVADNGGSSGRLRSEFGVLPPGDLRMALAALCGDDAWGRTWERVVQHRFAGNGEMSGHAVGNLLIVGLWELFPDPVEGLHWVAELLGARGRVLPMAMTPMDILAEVRGLDPAHPERLTTVRGQAEVATTEGVVSAIRLDPLDPPACPDAVEAIARADWIVLGPGSWYTSVIPHLLVPELREALAATSARVLVNLNLAGQQGETTDYGPLDHLAALYEHAPGVRIHTVLADPTCVADADELAGAVASWGARLVIAEIARDDATPRHDPERLASAYRQVLAIDPASVGEATAGG
jgi:uncharacterized cofD-like protein